MRLHICGILGREDPGCEVLVAAPVILETHFFSPAPPFLLSPLFHLLLLTLLLSAPHSCNLPSGPVFPLQKHNTMTSFFLGGPMRSQ